MRHGADESGQRRLECKGDGIIVDLFHAFEAVGELGVERDVIAPAHLIIGMLGIHHAMEGEDHVVGVHRPGRRELGVGLPCDVLAQGEGVGQPVFGHFPAFGQRGLDIGAAAFHRDQAVINLAQGVDGRAVARKLGIEDFRRTFQADGKHLGLRGQGGKGCNRPKQQSLFHDDPSRSKFRP